MRTAELRSWRKLSRVVACATMVLAGMTTAPRALDFKCVEASRYKDLLQIFDDNPAVLSSYFELDRTQAPDLNACRAMAVVGTIRDGDAERLIGAIIQNKRWLDVLYLAFDGVHLGEEIRLARVIRGFRLKTRVLQGWPLRYEPDYATAWAPPAENPDEAPTTPARQLSPITRGLEAFAKRGDLGLPISGSGNVCLEGCAGAWVAGVHRRMSPMPPIAVRPPAAVPEVVTAWPRRALSFDLDDAKPPPAGDATWETAVTPGFGPVVPPPIERLVREKCTAELVAGEALEGRIGGTLENLARGDFRDVGSMPLPVVAELDSLRVAGIRLQRCVARAFEHERLAAFSRLCGASCDKAKLTATFDRAAREFVDKQISLSSILGANRSGNFGGEWWEEESGWSGTWTRRGAESSFDASWTKGGGKVTAVVEIGRLAHRVAAVRMQTEGRCIYQGVIAADEKTARGTYTCSWSPGAHAWSATIQ